MDEGEFESRLTEEIKRKRRTVSKDCSFIIFMGALGIASTFLLGITGGCKKGFDATRSLNCR